ncbi:hypothetical protein [Clostridium cadaveris]
MAITQMPNGTNLYFYTTERKREMQVDTLKSRQQPISRKQRRKLERKLSKKINRYLNENAKNC